MSIESYGNILFGESPTPCFITHLETENVLFLNESMERLLTHISPADVIGKKYYHVMINRDFMKTASLKSKFVKDEFAESFIFNEILNLHFRISFSQLQYEDQVYVICKYFPIQDVFGNTFTFDEAMTRCVYYFQHPKEEMIQAFLELLCQYYTAERAYIYRISPHNQKITCQAQWCVDSDFRVTEELSEIFQSDQLLEWLTTRNEVGIIEADSQRIPKGDNSTPALVLETLQVKNLTMSMVVDTNGEVIGIVGISNRKDSYFDSRLINTISRFVAHDVDKTAMEETLHYVTCVDTLTEFSNRSVYNEKMAELAQNKPKTMGVVFININGLKKINKNLGCLEGDTHIKSAAKTVSQHFGYDFYRISGDEFVGIACDCEQDQFEEKVKELHEKMKLEDDYIFSMGHSWGEGNYDFPELVNHADTVMYINKQEYYYASNRHFTNVGDTTLSDLLSYLENDEFMVYLQPQVRLEDGALVAAEALIRRFDKTNQKMVFPDQFIPLYEMKSVIRHIDFFVIDQVCAFLAERKKLGYDMKISVNLSRVTLLEHGVVASIAEICDKYGVEHRSLIIEITERVGLIENNVASSLVTEFQNEGFTISLDDFGCAYSNIVTLAQIQVDELKIDKSLVDYLLDNRKNRVLVKNILTMCQELGDTSTLAEGIENEGQAKLLYELGCHLGQGYFYSRPIPMGEFCDKYFI